jgi:RecG-like helicase
VDAELRDRRRLDEGPQVARQSEGMDIEERLGRQTLANVIGTTPIPALLPRQRARVAGRVKSLTVQPWGDVPTLQVQLTDDQGKLIVAFLGRRQIAGLSPGSRIVVDGTVTERRGQLVMINPDYEFLPATEPRA